MKHPISEVYHGDCMDFMKTLPKGFADLAICDPPYGIGEDGRKTLGRVTVTEKWKNPIPKPYKNGGWDCKAPPVEYFNELRRVSKNQIVWGANHFISRLPYDSPCWIVWDKQNGETDFADCELAWTSFKSAVRVVKYMWAGFKQPSMKFKEVRIHPTQKPAVLYRYLLTNYAKPGQKIFDPMMGSQSSRIAAWDMGFDYYGCEKDEDYFRDGCARFEAHIKKPVLFAPEQMYNFEQAKLFE